MTQTPPEPEKAPRGPENASEEAWLEWLGLAIAELNTPVPQWWKGPPVKGWLWRKAKPGEDRTRIAFRVPEGVDE